jgi:NH3-dependent NAD+ synthetase
MALPTSLTALRGAATGVFGFWLGVSGAVDAAVAGALVDDGTPMTKDLGGPRGAAGLVAVVAGDASAVAASSNCRKISKLLVLKLRRIPSPDSGEKRIVVDG